MKTQTKPTFTPGKWTVDSTTRVLTNMHTNETFKLPEYFIKSLDGSAPVAKVHLGQSPQIAALIAAAPDLFAACEVVLNNLTTMIPANPELKKLGEKACIDALVAALKKARGES